MRETKFLFLPTPRGSLDTLKILIQSNYLTCTTISNMYYYLSSKQNQQKNSKLIFLYASLEKCYSSEFYPPFFSSRGHCPFAPPPVYALEKQLFLFYFKKFNLYLQNKQRTGRFPSIRLLSILPFTQLCNIFCFLKNL